MPRLIHTGQPLVDETVEVPSLPRSGDNVMATSCSREAGGSINILVATARQGVDAVLAGAVGAGSNGDLIRQVAAREGIAVPAPPIEGADTGICFVMVEPSAERTFVTTLGAERQLSLDILEASAPASGDIVCLTGYSFVVESTAAPHRAWLPKLPEGVGVVLDPGAAFAGLPEAERADLLALIDVWTGNADEAEALTDETEMGAAAAAVAALLRPDAVVIVRDGPAGCAVHVDGLTTLVPGFPRTPVDTNGAGDAHTGILLAARLSGVDWVEACRRANAGAAIKVTRRGPATAPTASEIDAFLATQRA